MVEYVEETLRWNGIDGMALMKISLVIRLEETGDQLIAQQLSSKIMIDSRMPLPADYDQTLIARILLSTIKALS